MQNKYTRVNLENSNYKNPNQYFDKKNPFSTQKEECGQRGTPKALLSATIRSPTKHHSILILAKGSPNSRNHMGSPTYKMALEKQKKKPLSSWTKECGKRGAPKTPLQTWKNVISANTLCQLSNKGRGKSMEHFVSIGK